MELTLTTVKTELVRWEAAGNQFDPYEWVNTNISKIRSFLHKRGYIQFSPYEEEEFIQQAYLAAIEADSKARSNCKGYEYYFWNTFKNYCRGLTYTKGQRIPCYHEEYIEYGDSNTPPTRIPEKYTEKGVDEIFKRLISDKKSIDKKTRNKLIDEAFLIMRPLERKVWQYLLKGYRICDIAKKMGYRRQRIQKLRNRGLERVKEYFEKKGNDSF